MNAKEFEAYKMAYQLYEWGYIREDQIEECVKIKLKKIEEEQKTT